MPIAPKSAAASTAAAEAAAAARAAVTAAKRPQPRQQRLPQSPWQRTRLTPVTAGAAAAAAAGASVLAAGRTSDCPTHRRATNSTAASTSLWLNRRLLVRRPGRVRIEVDRGVGGGCKETSGTRAGSGNNATPAAAAAAGAAARRRTSASVRRPPMLMPRRSAAPAAAPAPTSRQHRQAALAANNSATPDRQEPAGQPPAAADIGKSAGSSRTAAVTKAEKAAQAPAATGNKQQPMPMDADPTETDDDEDSSQSMPEPDAENAVMSRVNLYSQKLRSRLAPRVLGRSGRAIEANMHLVRLRRHPTQLADEAGRLAEMGITREDQLHRQRQIASHLAKARERSGKKKKKKTGNDDEDQGPVPYPDWIPFKLRFKRANSEELWDAFIVRRRDLVKIMGERAPADVKPNEKYNQEYIDVWTKSLTVQARPTSILCDLVRPVFTRLGLDNRADFKVTIGCFYGDTRQGGPKIKGMPKNSVEVSLLTPVSALYESGFDEIFISPWLDMASEFPPGYFDRPVLEQRQSTAGGKKEGEQQQVNTSQSNEQLVQWHLRASQMAARMRWRRSDKWDGIGSGERRQSDTL